MLRVLVQFVWLSQNTTDREIYKEMPLAVLEDQSIPRCWLASGDGLLAFLQGRGNAR